MDVSEFIRTYGKPYDPATDDYDVPPFQEHVENASKSSRIYHAQRYWTKQDAYTVKRFIEHYTKPGEIVLDAFCGTGMTGVAALMSGRHAILFDISPVCIHMARNFTTPIAPGELDRAYRIFHAQVDKEIAPLYQTTCHKCHNKEARIISTLLSDVYKCPRCDAEVIFAHGERWQQLKAGKKIEKLKCPECNHLFAKGRATLASVIPIELRISCPRCKVIGVEATRTVTKKDLNRFYEIEQMAIPYWYPKDVKFPTGYNTRQPLKRGITHPYQMFTHRNLIALSVIWHHINLVSDSQIQSKLTFAFTSSIFLASMMLSWRPRRIDGEIREGLAGPEGYRAGTLYIPSVISEKDVLLNFDQKVKLVIGGMTDILAGMLGKSSDVVVTKGSAMNLSGVPSKSVDYLFYDPPYGGNINYSELDVGSMAWRNH